MPPVSLGLDAGELDHVGELFGVICDQAAECDGRTRKSDVAQIRDPRLDFRIGKTRSDFLIELVDDLDRCVFGCPNLTNSGIRLLSGHCSRRARCNFTPNYVDVTA